MLMKNILLTALSAALAVLVSSGCSRQKVPPPPKTQPELLLEIYDAARKQQYNATLLKIQKMRAMDPTNIFLAELENTIRFNRMTAVVSTYIDAGNFEAALETIRNYEKKYGTSDESSRTREQLSQIIELDRQIRSVKAARYSDQLEQELAKLKALAKKIKIPPGIANFIQKKESVIPELRDREKAITRWEIRQLTVDSLMAKDRRVAAVLAAVCTAESPSDAEQILSLVAGPDAAGKP